MQVGFHLWEIAYSNIALSGSLAAFCPLKVYAIYSRDDILFIYRMICITKIKY